MQDMAERADRTLNPNNPEFLGFALLDLGMAAASRGSIVPIRAGPSRLHGNSLATPRPAQGYTLRSRSTGEVLKYGETTRGRSRYTQGYLDANNADMVFEASGTKGQMHQWQYAKILDYKASNGGSRPPLNKSDY
jgi:hypothetical protein